MTRLAGFFGLYLCLNCVLPNAMFAQERNLPEEIRALAAVCSSGARFEFRGEIEGGLNKIFGRIIQGSGDLSISDNEAEFLNSFKDERLRLEARKIFNDCVRSALEIVYNSRDTLNSSDGGDNSSRILVPDPYSPVKPGQTFALRVQQSIPLQRGGVFAISRARYRGYTPVGTVTNRSSSHFQLDIGSYTRVPNSDPCRVTFYSRRPTGQPEEFVYSFRYEC